MIGMKLLVNYLCAQPDGNDDAVMDTASKVITIFLGILKEASKGMSGDKDKKYGSFSRFFQSKIRLFLSLLVKRIKSTCAKVLPSHCSSLRATKALRLSSRKMIFNYWHFLFMYHSLHFCEQPSKASTGSLLRSADGHHKYGYQRVKVHEASP